MADSKQIENRKSKIENLKILLWDIDGTLMSSNVSGAFKQYFAPVMEEIYGSSGKLDGLKVSGMTDTQIFYESLRDEGFTPEQILGASDKLLPVFKRRMTEIIGKTETAYIIKTGARAILEATSKDSRFLNALLTGNLSVAAQIKLEYFDLWKYFENAPNVFGEISHDRRELGKKAVGIADKFLGAKLKPEQFVVIGDTPNDIAAARAFGARMVSVATGRNHPPEELAKYKPDVLLNDLSDTKKLLEIFKNL
ncbi:MAG: HAD family hydrolase [Acidobacteriota bacterium]|nr:HAD family hydrolase [Acidobacteriota bacterium]